MDAFRVNLQLLEDKRMAHRIIRILVVDPVGNDYAKIRGLLELCGVFRYEVDHASGPETVQYAITHHRYDCFFVDIHCALRGATGILSGKGRRDALPMVFLCDGIEANMGLSAADNCVPRNQLTLAALLLSISNAIRKSSRRQRSKSDGLALPVFLSKAEKTAGI